MLHELKVILELLQTQPSDLKLSSAAPFAAYGVPSDASASSEFGLGSEKQHFGSSSSFSAGAATHRGGTCGSVAQSDTTALLDGGE